MDANLAWVQQFLQAEYELLQARCRFDPEYLQRAFELQMNTFLMKPQVAPGVEFENPAFTLIHVRLSPERLSEAQRRHCDELEPRVALKAEQFSEPRLGEVTRVLLGGDEIRRRLWPDYIFYVAQVEQGTRVVALAQPCLDCFGMGDGAGGSCGAIEPITEARCAGGQVPRGGLALNLGKRIGVSRLKAPSRPLWLPLYEA